MGWGMKIVGFIPYWKGYQVTNDVSEHKNFKKLGGKYLINYSLNALSRIENINQVILYASDRSVLEVVDDELDFDFLQRPNFLDSSDIPIEDIIDEFLKVSDADVIVMLHPNSPFLQLATINECVSKVVSGKFDSSFTACQYKKLAWFKGVPLNYSLHAPTPHLDQLASVIFEQSSLYVFNRESYLLKKKRVGENPYIKFIDHFEGHEVNLDEDFKIAELIVNSGMYHGY